MAHHRLDEGINLQLHIFVISLILVSVSNLQWDLRSCKAQMQPHWQTTPVTYSPV